MIGTAESALRGRMAAALELLDEVELVGPATLAAAYPVSDLAAASVATAAAATVGLCAALGFGRPAARVQRPVADAWFGLAVTGVGWSPPPLWDAIAGDYSTDSGWIRLHTNAEHHRRAALQVLGVEAVRDDVARAVSQWAAEDLQDAVVAAGGCAAALRSPADWALHPQGVAVAGQPLVAVTPTEAGGASPHWRPTRDRPLAGLRVLDLTRVLAGPAATRLLAGLGADVLRIDPPWWNEPAVEPEMTLGKRVARLDARTADGRDQLLDLLAECDVLVHGYRGGALAGLGLDPAERSRRRPGLIDVSLSAYGPEGPWAGRRGFDSLVQMSTGIAAAGLLAGEAEQPTPLPVQALDHGTGYLMAAAVLRGLTRQVTTGAGTRAVLSLARTAAELEAARSMSPHPVGPAPAVGAVPLTTAWGPGRLLEPPITIDGVAIRWERGPSPLGSDPPRW